ncbi:Zona pellucida sperm-binding protein 3 [Dissostichus eleginoides]|uniref:Zona pellucida sperm-binding protein 3 n=1 Tax=Dissostichus eleginoides TaxID=100907 RepID=A0AAD9CBI0_DISEL|nr:Zona pellucida sperm-binding protein 3 [Dissostichus eleginoides]
MGTQLYLGVIVVMLFATTVANAEIKVQCEKDSISITLTIPSRLRQYAARYFLGNCMPSRFNVLPSGEGKAEFNYKLADCNFKRLMKGKHLIYKNELTFRPRPRSSPAAYVYPIECVYPRPKGVAEGRGGLKFHMLLLNEKMTEVAETNVIPLGSFMPIWATVEQKSHQPLLLLMEECVAATTPELQANSNVYPIIRNKGCLLDSVKGNSRFLPRYHSSAIILYLQSFKFGLGEEVYIHCKLLAWDPEVLSESKKACHYVKENERWELLDDPMQSSMCDCCSRTCNPRSKRGDQWESNGFRPKDWYATIYDPVFKTYSLGDLQFNIGLMNEDFSGPAESTRFPLGSIIPIMASVVQNTHQPLLLLLEECVAATTPELYPESTMYPIISNKGCLLESVSSRSKFEPRQKSSEIRLSLQTFTFAMGEEVFIHCKLLAWDPNGLDSTKKACHFVEGHGWELLDNLAQSNLCDCCESTCKSRRQRSVASVLIAYLNFFRCLLDSVKGNSRFLPRYHSSAIILYLQSFKFGLGEEVYIHCKLLAWDPEVLSESKKACHYVKENERWELLDDPMQSSMCDCCSRTCNPRSKRGDQWESNGFRPKDWYATIYDPVFKTYSLGDLQFNIGLMNEDFSGPAESTRFPLGSIIPIMASVVQKTHQPLLLLLEECVAATTPELYPESTMYPIISNKGCLLESVSSRSKFEPRQKSSEIRLSLQTFTFAMGEEVFIHCKLLAWDPNGLDSTKKACHFVEGHGWELLDNLAQSNLCDCCESTCKSRRQRSVASGMDPFR